MLSFRQVSRHADADLVSFIRTVASAHGHRNVFNPSAARAGDALLVAYRAIPAGEEKIRAYLVVRSTAAAPVRVTDLSALGAERGLSRVADPKIVQAGEELYVTFNTGYVPSSQQNDIFLVRVHPTVGPLQRVAADFERQSVEKNWAFLIDGRSLMAVYRLHPYAEVVLVDGDLGSSDDLVLSMRVPARADSAAGASLSIGTQLLEGDGAHHLIAHEKWTLRGRRSYFGRAVTIEGIASDDVAVRTSEQRLIHRWQDALPRRGVHNVNLMSATYFSGLERRGEDIVLEYGINDTDFSIAELKGNSLWP